MSVCVVSVLTAAALGAAPLRLRGGAHPRDNNLELPQHRLRGGGSSSHPLDSPSALPRLRQLQETLSGAESSSLRHLDPAELASLASELRGAISAPDAEGLTRLHRAVMEQDNRRVQRLLAASADVEAAAGPLGVRPLHLAVLAGDERTGVLEQLIKAGADPAARDARGTGAIHAAVALNLPHVTDLLLGAGVAPEGKGAKGALPIQLAAWANAAEAIEALLARRADADACDARRRTACHAAAAADSVEALEVLVDCGANAEAQDRRGRRPLHYAVRACRCADPDCTRTRALRLLLERGADHSPRDGGGWTPLHLAAEHNRIAALRMLLDAGVPPDAHDAEGSCTPLMLAAHAGARKTLSALLEAGADVSARDASRVTALQAAAAGGRAKALRLLLAAGAAANVTDDVGSSAAFYAARAGSAGCLRALHEAGGDVHAPNQFGWTPLHAASNFSQCEAVGALLRGAAAAPSPADEVGWTPLHVASNRVGSTGGCECPGCLRTRARGLQCMRLLLRRGAKRDLADTQGATAAHIAAAHDCGAALRLLRAHGADVWRRDAQGRTPLRVARDIAKPSSAVQQLLLMRGRGGLEAPQDW